MNKKELEEAAGAYLDNHKPLTRYNWGDLMDAFIAGAEWQKNKMMEKAVEGIAHPDDCEIWVNLVGHGYKLKDGDKVRVIVIKED